MVKVRDAYMRFLPLSSSALRNRFTERLRDETVTKIISCSTHKRLSWGTGELDVHEFLRNLEWLLSRRLSHLVLRLFAGKTNPVKELSEALSMFLRVYSDENTRSRDTIVIEVCSGDRAPVAVMTALFVKRGRGWAVDACKPSSVLLELQQSLGDRLRLFFETDIRSDAFRRIVEDARSQCEYLVVVGIHCCKTLAVRVLEVFKEVGGDRLLLVPCCAKPSWARRVVGTDIRGYWDWVYALWKYAHDVLNLPARVYVEKSMLSEANAVIEVVR